MTSRTHVKNVRTLMSSIFGIEKNRDLSLYKIFANCEKDYRCKKKKKVKIMQTFRHNDWFVSTESAVIFIADDNATFLCFGTSNSRRHRVLQKKISWITTANTTTLHKSSHTPQKKKKIFSESFMALRNCNSFLPWGSQLK